MSDLTGITNNCNNCKHGEAEFDAEPCQSCLDHARPGYRPFSLWESEEPRDEDGTETN